MSATQAQIDGLPFVQLWKHQILGYKSLVPKDWSVNFNISCSKNIHLRILQCSKQFQKLCLGSIYLKKCKCLRTEQDRLVSNHSFFAVCIDILPSSFDFGCRLLCTWHVASSQGNFLQLWRVVTPDTMALRCRSTKFSHVEGCGPHLYGGYERSLYVFMYDSVVLSDCSYGNLLFRLAISHFHAHDQPCTEVGQIILN